MESNYKFVGQKFERNLSFHEVAKILGTSNVKVLELLRENQILFKEGLRNLPYDKYLRKQWFEVNYIQLDKPNFKGIVPKVLVTEIGFNEIEKLLLKNPKFVNAHNSRTFWIAVRFKLNESLCSLGVKFNNFDEWLNKNSICHNENGKSIFTVFAFINEQKQTLVKYDLKKKIIIDNER